MRGTDHQQSQMFSYLSPETRVVRPLLAVKVHRRIAGIIRRRGILAVLPLKTQTHASKTDPDAKLARKGKGKEGKLSYSGNLLVENRNGLIVNSEVFEANGTAERDAAPVMLEQLPGTKRVTAGGDKGFDTCDFVAECRNLQVTPHVAQNHERRGGSAIDECRTRHQAYRISQIKRKRIEECFGWLKTIALLRKVRHRGIFKVDWVFSFACAAYNLVRMRNLSRVAV